MNDEFDNSLINCLQRFIKEQDNVFANENVYGFAFIYPPEGQSLACAIGTTERLEEVVYKYIKLGYKNSDTNNHEGLKEWLKWSGPEDGWAGLHSDAFSELNAFLQKLIKEKKIKLYSDYLRKRITKNIKKIRKLAPNCKDCVFLFAYDFFSLELANYNKRINTIENYLKWQKEQIKAESLSNLIKKM